MWSTTKEVAFKCSTCRDATTKWARMGGRHYIIVTFHQLIMFYCKNSFFVFLAMNLDILLTILYFSKSSSIKHMSQFLHLDWMNLNRVYKKNEDGGVGFFSIMEHTIARAINVALEEERNRNIPNILIELMQVSIEGGDVPEEITQCNRLQKNSAVFFFFFFKVLIHLLGVNQIPHQVTRIECNPYNYNTIFSFFNSK